MAKPGVLFLDNPLRHHSKTNPSQPAQLLMIIIFLAIPHAQMGSVGRVFIHSQ